MVASAGNDDYGAKRRPSVRVPSGHYWHSSANLVGVPLIDVQVALAPRACKSGQVWLVAVRRHHRRFYARDPPGGRLYPTILARRDRGAQHRAVRDMSAGFLGKAMLSNKQIAAPATGGGVPFVTKYCDFHGECAHTTAECRVLQKDPNAKPDKSRNRTRATTRARTSPARARTTPRATTTRSTCRTTTSAARGGSPCKRSFFRR